MACQRNTVPVTAMSVIDPKRTIFSRSGTAQLLDIIKPHSRTKEQMMSIIGASWISPAANF
jgi:hypothetical protein